MVDSVSYFSFSQCSTTGVTKVVVCVCGMVRIKEPLLLLEKCLDQVVAVAGFSSDYLSDPLRRHITVLKEGRKYFI